MVSAQKQKASDTIYHYEDLPLKRQQVFYEKWKTKAEKRKLTSNIFNILFSSPQETTPRQLGVQTTHKIYEEYEGKIIRKIHIIIVKPFGVRDQNRFPTDSTDNIAERLGNNVHKRTSVEHIKNILSIEEGNPLDVRQLEDKEEYLRNLSYIDELYIEIIPNGDDTIDISFLIRDRFSWSVSYQAHDIDAHKFRITNRNLWGRGHTLKQWYYYNRGKRVKHNIKTEYYIPSFFNTLIEGRFIYERQYTHNKYSMDLNRGFIDYRKKYAGGFRINKMTESEQAPTNSVIRFENNLDFIELDGWVGVTIPYDLKKGDKYARYRKALTGRVYSLRFQKHPLITPDSNRFLLNTTGAILGYNVSKKQLVRSNLIYNYGKIENIPYGYLAQLFVGGVTNADERKGYLGFNFEKGYYSKRDHYFYLGINGGTLLNKDRLVDGLVQIKGQYITRLYKWKHSLHRHFFTINYTKGFNSIDDFLSLDEKEGGISNLKSKYTTGDEKFTTNIESVFFTPHTLAGFRMALFSFADLGYIGSNSTYMKKDRLYASIGAGVRLRNDNFIFRTFQISFSLFLKAPPDVNLFVPDATSIKKEYFRDFQIEKPLFFFEREDWR